MISQSLDASLLVEFLKPILFKCADTCCEPNTDFHEKMTPLHCLAVLFSINTSLAWQSMVYLYC